MNGRYNTRSPAVKRLMREAQELSEPTDQYFAQPLDDNLFEWHFTIRGPADSDFQNGIYHGRIILPVDYPMKPPSIIWLTPNGRFETNKKICLSISGHHPESWQPSWSIRTALLAIVGFMPTHPGGAIGSLDYTPDERKVMAKKSRDWKCPTCGDITGILLEVGANTETTANEAKELAAQINFQGEKPKCKDGECPIEQERLAQIQTQAKTSESTNSGGPSQTTNGAANTEASNGTLNNTSSNVNTEAPLSPSSITVSPQASIPQFPQWPGIPPPFPMPPAGFPMPFPTMPPLQPMQFPYPPSHYSNYPQYPWPFPPHTNQRMAMFPNTYPLPSQNCISTDPNPYPTSTNNSSNQSADKNKADQYTRSPMTSSVMTQRQVPDSSSSSNRPYKQWKIDVQDRPIPNNCDLLEELLSKVPRVESEKSQVGGNTEQHQEETTDHQSASPRTPKTNRKSDHTSSRLKKGDAHVNPVDEGADSELSKLLKKTGDRSVSVSERGDTNTEDNSESDAPCIDVDQVSGLEKGACSSTSDLERWKQKYQLNKGIRQRQSATASVPTELPEEGAAEPERQDASNARQRIEAVSGDTGSRNIGRSRYGHRNVENRQENVVRERETTFDFSFYVMVGLFAASLMILLNRLVSMDWSESES